MNKLRWANKKNQCPQQSPTITNSSQVSTEISIYVHSISNIFPLEMDVALYIIKLKSQFLPKKDLKNV